MYHLKMSIGGKGGTYELKVKGKQSKGSMVYTQVAKIRPNTHQY